MDSGILLVTFSEKSKGISATRRLMGMASLFEPFTTTVLEFCDSPDNAVLESRRQYWLNELREGRL